MINIHKINSKYQFNKPNRLARRISSHAGFHLNPVNYLFNSFVNTKNRLSENNSIPIASKIISDDVLIQQMVKDIAEHLSEQKQKDLWVEIDQFIKDENLNIEQQDKQLHILKAMATYATSYSHYGPVITEFAQSLLDTSLLEKRKLVFLARDGIAPYKAAMMLKEANAPKYDSVELSIIYVSRTLAYSSTLMDEEISKSDTVVQEYVKTLKNRDPYILRKYILQETGLKEKDRCLIIDVGFTGSIIPPIIAQLEDLGISMRFKFLISHTSKKKIKLSKHDAKGFLAHREKRPLEVVDKAGGNPAVHWIEDTHQSVFMSAKILIVNEKGRIVPAIVSRSGEEFHVQELFGESPKTCRHIPEEFLLKTYGLKGVLDAVAPIPDPEPAIAYKEASEHRRQVFASFLSTLQTKQRALLIKH